MLSSPLPPPGRWFSMSSRQTQASRTARVRPWASPGSPQAPCSVPHRAALGCFRPSPGDSHFPEAPAQAQNTKAPGGQHRLLHKRHGRGSPGKSRRATRRGAEVEGRVLFDRHNRLTHPNRTMQSTRDATHPFIRSHTYKASITCQ